MGEEKEAKWVPAHPPTLTSKPYGHSTRSFYVVDAVDAMYNTYICSCYIHGIYNLTRCYVHAMYIYTYVSIVCVSVVSMCIRCMYVHEWMDGCSVLLHGLLCIAMQTWLRCVASPGIRDFRPRHSMMAFHHHANTFSSDPFV